MTDHKAKLSEIRQRHERASGPMPPPESYVRWAWYTAQDAHEDRATLLEIVAGLERSPIPVKPIDKSGYCILCEQNARDRDTERARAEAAESDAKHVRAINATLLESMAAETKRADAAERALAEVREKVKALDRLASGAKNGWGCMFRVNLGEYLERRKVLAALGVES